MEESVQHFDRETLARAERLMLRARRVVEGVRSGMHRSPFHGASVEFAEHKEYTPGDPLRTVDWKLYGKSDKYYVKRYLEETNLNAWILLDTSASMGYGRLASQRESWWQRFTQSTPFSSRPSSRRSTGESTPSEHELLRTKLDYASLLAASLAYLLITQGDAVGLCTFNQRGEQVLPARTRASHLHSMMGQLSSCTPAGQGFIGQALTRFAPRVNRRSLVILISDLLEDSATILQGLKQLRTRRNDVLILQVLHADELQFPYDEVSLFEDPEARDQQLIADPRDVREGYLTELNAWLERLRRDSFEAQVELQTLSTQTPVASALADVVSSRRKGGRA